MLAKIKDVEISWDGIWLIIFICGCISLIFVNFKTAKDWNDKRLRKKERYWNMNLCDAIYYIGHLTHFGANWPQNEKQTYSARALYDAAKKGLVDIAGVTTGSMTLTKIPKCRFNGKRIFELKHCASDEEKNAFLLKADLKTVDYFALTADRKQIEKQWPSKPGSWMSS